MYSAPTITMPKKNTLVGDNAFFIPLLIALLAVGTTATVLVWNQRSRDEAVRLCHRNGGWPQVSSKFLGAAWEVKCNPK